MVTNIYSSYKYACYSTEVNIMCVYGYTDSMLHTGLEIVGPYFVSFT